MTTGTNIVQYVSLAVFVFICGWFLWLWFSSSRSPKMLIFRWVLTVTIVGWLLVQGRLFKDSFAAGSPAAIMVVIYAAVGGLVMAMVWVPVITAAASNLFGALYDGGFTEVEPAPFYSIFRTKRSQGKYFEALAEVRRQLDKFPTDFEGHMLLAELQAENLNDLPGAAITIDKACRLPNQTSQNIAFALNRLADWHLGLTKDRDSAQRVFEKIIEVLPDTEMALRASQRIAHLADSGEMLASHDRVRINVKKGVQNLGLLRNNSGKLQPPTVDQEKVAAEYVAHLEQHPLDADIHEKLAVIYCKHYHRLDLAVDQLEQLIAQPGHAAKQIVHWLNLKADLQILEGADETAVRETVQRIIDLFPDIAASHGAQRRLDNLKLEMKVQTKARSVQMGVYEQNLGLKPRLKTGTDS